MNPKSGLKTSLLATAFFVKFISELVYLLFYLLLGRIRFKMSLLNRFSCFCKASLGKKSARQRRNPKYCYCYSFTLHFSFERLSCVLFKWLSFQCLVRSASLWMGFVFEGCCMNKPALSFSPWTNVETSLHCGDNKTYCPMHVFQNTRNLLNGSAFCFLPLQDLLFPLFQS